MKPGTALLALSFRRHTLTILFVLGWTALLVVFVPEMRALPAPILLAASMPAIAQWFVLVAQVSYPQSDLTAPGSGYSEFLLRLPMTTRGLALWPILASIASSLALWLTLTFGYYARAGISIPFGSSCGIVASALGAVFVISYRPFARGWLRLLLLATALLTVIGLAVWLRPPDILYAALTIAEILLSIGSVGLARRNANVTSPSERSVSSADHRLFASSRQAMFWMEWKLRGRPFPYTVAAFAAVLSVPLAFMGSVPGELAGHVAVNGWIPLGLPVLVLGATLISMLMRPDATMSKHDRSTFFMTLPVADSEILNSKRREQTAEVALATLIVLAVIVGWLLLPPAPLLTLLRRSSMSIVIGGILWVALIWRSRTVWTFAAVCQDEARSRSIGMGSIVLPILTIMPVGIALDSGATFVGMLPYLSPALALLLVFRGLLAFRIGRTIAVQSDRNGTDCRRFVTAWIVATFLLWGLLLWLFSLQPDGYRSMVKEPALVAFLMAATAAPLVRPLLARQYLFLARHG